MITQAIRLDNKAETGPKEVDFVTLDHLFGQRVGESRCSSDGTEEDLQDGVGESERVLVQENSQGTHPRLPGEVLEFGAQSLGVDEVVLVGIVHGTL